MPVLNRMTVDELEAHKAKLEADLEAALARPGCSQCTKNSFRSRIRQVDRMIDKKRKAAAAQAGDA